MCANISHSYEYGYTAGKLAADWLNTNCSASQTVACALLTKPQSLAVIDRANGIIEGLRGKLHICADRSDEAVFRSGIRAGNDRTDDA